MKAQDKELLLKDLCARLPYEVQCEIGGRLYGPYTFVGDDVEDLIAGRTFKPYLRPLSSMTEEENKEYKNCYQSDDTTTATLLVDFYNKKHLDYRGLIEKGLAIAVTEENNPYKD